MKASVGYSDHPESEVAGVNAAKMALAQAGRSDPCDLAMLFSTARHDQVVLREAVVSVIGDSVPVYGGGAAGIITNDYFGYAGDQVGIACIWLDGVCFEALIESEMNKGEEEAGIRLGKRLAGSGATPDSPLMVFYDTFDFTEGVRMLMATWLLAGIEKGLGFIPNLTGAGMIGHLSPVPTRQWTGDGMGEHNVITLAFSGDIRMDSVIMHGCRPATGYFTVTKSVGQVILEINGKPAIQFIDELLDSAIAPEQYPFFLIFGVNHGERWGEYDEDYYANRLCLDIDKQSGGIVMFEPDMVEGTEFQLMFRSSELDYIKPKIDKAFDELEGRKPVFAVYINCAGRCSGYAGNDLEDAIVLQDAVSGRVPVLGMYTGVEIATIGGHPRGLDWTGVFCLFSQSADGCGDSGKKSSTPEWSTGVSGAASIDAPTETLLRLCERNAAMFLALDSGSIAIRYELEQKRRGFVLLSELSTSLRQSKGYDNVFGSASKRINAALNMERTVVMIHDGKGRYTVDVMQGYTVTEKAKFAGLHIEVPPELLDPDNAVIVTGADSADRLSDFRQLLGLPYFISAPVVFQGKVHAILITGRLIEEAPYLVRLSRSDMETVKAISALLVSVLGRQRLAAAEERNRLMIDTLPVCCTFWDETGALTDCNRETLSMFRLSSKDEFIDKFDSLSPEYQPGVASSGKTINDYVMRAFVAGELEFRWTFQMPDGELLPAQITLIRVPKGEDYTVVGYIRDLREQEAVDAKLNEARELAERHIRAKNEFLASVSHEIRTPLNAIQAMARAAGDIMSTDDSQQALIRHGIYSIELLTSAIETILDFSKLDTGQLSLEIAEFSVRELIAGICGMIRDEVESKKLLLTSSVDDAVPDTLLGDQVRLRQVLFNIIINAVKFTDEGSIDVRVIRDESQGAENVPLVFEIRDTGIGISDNQMTNLFKPLYVGDTSYSRAQSGLGMGLAISSGLIMLMDGSIDCESSVGKGSIFRVRVSLAQPEDKAAQADIEPVMYDNGMLRGLRVLVAEDNNINQMIIEELLAGVGIDVSIAANGVEALEKLKEESFDIVLMDILMPEMDGLTATIQIRADSQYDNLPILAMTANAGVEHYNESISAGMNDHLTKPVDPEQLFSALAKWSKR